MRILSIIVSFCFLFVALLFPLSASAYTSESTLQDFQKTLATPEYNKESFDFQSLAGVGFSMTSLLLGCTLDTDGNGTIDREACPTTIKTGTLPLMGNALAGLMSTPPASGSEYLADLGQKLNIVQPAYAQTGFGFNASQPFLVAWRAVRNFTYLLMVIVAIGFGIAIMLRTRISPQAVITIQSALPRIIVGLILITFSYAIVGLLIDLMYVLFGLLVWGLQVGGLYSPTEAQKYFEDFSSASFPDAVGFVKDKGFQGALDILRSSGLGISAGVAGLAGVLGAIVAFFAALANPAGATAAIGIALVAIPFLLGLVIALVAFLFRILFTFAKAYLLLILHLVLAPIIILWASATGSGIWNGWLKGTLSHLLVFPLAGILVFLTDVLIRVVDQSGGNIWAPPYVGGGAIIIKGMLALGAVMLLNNIPDMINQFLNIRGALPVPLPQLQQQIQQLTNSITQAGTKVIGNCMPFNASVDTPIGSKFIQDLKQGDFVWTVNASGERVMGRIKAVIKRAVPETHKMLNILLADGRSLLASPMHPTVDGIRIDFFSVGNQFDGSSISRIETTQYKDGYIYDILPEGETGGYWANGVLIGSTLFEKDHPQALTL